MSFAGMIVKYYFHVEGFVPRFVIKKRHFDEKTEAVYTSYFFFLQIAIFLKQVFVFIKFKKKGGT